MATLKEQISVAATGITITLASLGSGSWRQSVFVENTTNLSTARLIQMAPRAQT